MRQLQTDEQHEYVGGRLKDTDDNLAAVESVVGKFANRDDKVYKANEDDHEQREHMHERDEFIELNFGPGSLVQLLNHEG